ncbi:dnaJ homolog subfamily C member 9-like [Limulus polyphemus]|uniref:DnaJ homolog subfamily C member 9-like n=1 Tax=Limulus polyphemus TaxID=6850 RepID=A0ABM1T3H7_LIMPO|nr:dnaJ homolog subfamily C member 9-like [Limulus polyphemus]
MGLLDDCYTYFGTKKLYFVLGTQEGASEKELKTAYRKLSLKVHPDRTEESQKAEATKKFQTLAKVYFILSDQEKRAVYDETGEVDDENDIPPERDWSVYWRLLFPKVSQKDIENYLKKYKGLEEEKKYLVCLLWQTNFNNNVVFQYLEEATEAEELKKQMGLSADGCDISLEHAITARNQSREKTFDSLMSSLEAKYCKPGKPKGRAGKKK